MLGVSQVSLGWACCVSADFFVTTTRGLFSPTVFVAKVIRLKPVYFSKQDSFDSCQTVVVLVNVNRDLHKAVT